MQPLHCYVGGAEHERLSHTSRADPVCSCDNECSCCAATPKLASLITLWAEERPPPATVPFRLYWYARSPPSADVSLPAKCAFSRSLAIPNDVRLGSAACAASKCVAIVSML